MAAVERFELSGPKTHQVALDRFVSASEADPRVLAAFLGGSYARGAADAYSDLDLCLVTADDTYADFYADRHSFMRQVGEPIFLEDHRGLRADVLFFVFADGTEGELALSPVSAFHRMHVGAYRPLLDRMGLLVDVSFLPPQRTQDEQVETVRRLIMWFWHDLLHHFLTPIARGELWSAYGALDDLRRTCLDLARFTVNPEADLDAYEQVERLVPTLHLAPLAAMCCPLERADMIRAACEIVRYYEQTAPPLAQTYSIAYPAELALLLSTRLDRLEELDPR
jgi:hypothetical protein